MVMFVVLISFQHEPSSNASGGKGLTLQLMSSHVRGPRSDSTIVSPKLVTMDISLVEILSILQRYDFELL